MLGLLLAAALSAPAGAQIPRLGPMDAARCAPEGAGPALHSGDFRWGYSLPELIAAFDALYPGPKRLPRRAYWNAAKARYELPYLPERGGPVVLPESFIATVRRHAEAAFADGVVDGVFFPDMGHSHFLIPEALWEAKYAKYPTEKMSRMYSDLLADPALEVLYHTAEQLETRKPDGSLSDDPRTRRRHETRNIVGRNDGAPALRILQNPASRANTVVEVPGFFWWSAGFNVSASAGACFAFSARGRALWFDLSLFDLEPAPGAGGFSASSRGDAAPTGDCPSLRRERGS